MKTFVYSSPFVDAVTALVKGDTDCVDRLERDRERSGRPPVMVDIWTVLATLRDAGVATMADNGWWSFRHPQLGHLYWKTSVGNYEQPGRCLILGVVDKIVVEIWPRQDGGPLIPIWTDLPSVADVESKSDVTPNTLRPFVPPPTLN